MNDDDQIQICPYCGSDTEERHEVTVCMECQLCLEGTDPEYRNVNE